MHRVADLSVVFAADDQLGLQQIKKGTLWVPFILCAHKRMPALTRHSSYKLGAANEISTLLAC